MREYATQKGMIVYSRKDLMRIPNEYFDAVFASYVFHMAVDESDIVKIVPKIKKKAVWIVNFYKGINEKYINSVFENIGFNVKRININTERFGHIYEYAKKGLIEALNSYEIIYYPDPHRADDLREFLELMDTHDKSSYYELYFG